MKEEIITLQEWLDIQFDEYLDYLEERNQDISNEFLKGNRSEANRKKIDKRIALDKYKSSNSFLKFPNKIQKQAAGITANRKSRERGFREPLIRGTYYKGRQPK